jgi:hypothetical protein
MPPAWLTARAWAALAVAFASTGWIGYDIYGRGYRQHMKVMEAVWPVTALYFGPAAVAAYRAWGRPASHRWRYQHGDPPPRPGYTGTATGVSHCGAGAAPKSTSMPAAGWSPAPAPCPWASGRC